MAETIRAFIAIEVPVSEDLQFVRNELQEMGRPVRLTPDPLHLTLKFLGDSNRTSLTSITDAMDAVAANWPKSDAEIQGLGAFPRNDRPSVVWAGIRPAEPLLAIAADLESLLEPLGFPAESRAFHPHLTLARIKGRPPRELTTLLEEFSDQPFGQLSVTQLSLIHSDLTRAGPHYTALHESPMAE